MSMGQELLIREVFRLGGGTTVLACEGTTTFDTLKGQQVQLVVDGQVRQSIMLANERGMLNQATHLNQRALETLESMEISLEEVRGGRCRLVLV